MRRELVDYFSSALMYYLLCFMATNGDGDHVLVDAFDALGDCSSKCMVRWWFTGIFVGFHLEESVLQPLTFLNVCLSILQGISGGCEGRGAELISAKIYYPELDAFM